ncbi:YccT family protein [Vibrio astriarenae]|uniref:YccT family protein n=1 Tax=Vibrio astriarenae TaxID=1481923 RepID=UPI0037369041
MKIKALTLVTMLSMSLSSFAATLSVNDTVDILVVNMEKPQLSGQSFNSIIEVDLPEGANQIVFQYEPVIETTNERKKVYGQTQVVTFTLSQDQNVQFKMPNYRSVRSAEKGLKDLDFSIIDQHGNEVEKTVDVLKSEGIQLGRNHIEEVREYNINGGPAAVAISYVAIDNTAKVAKPVVLQEPEVAPQSATPVQLPELDSKELQQLKTWYTEASQEDRKAFRKWLIDFE